VHLDAVDLSYSNLAFRDNSIKSAVLNRVLRKRRPDLPDVRALRQVTLEIEGGERVALLGHNGSGKTTMLKVIAGLYPISAGSSNVEGEVRSLFDLSLGFEPEATGLENILFRGLLLGRSPKEIRRLTPEIVEVTDIGEFIDYPIKTYSAGMLVRLAFAISTAVHGDILLLDEVIGAGDARFMQAAKARILNLIEQSEILVLASHDMSAVKQLCTRAVVLEKGRVIFDGPVSEGVSEYRRSMGVAG
jgi:homopolymeric O-antigen transport system ATP-binding protein